LLDLIVQRLQIENLFVDVGHAAVPKGRLFEVGERGSLQVIAVFDEILETFLQFSLQKLKGGRINAGSCASGNAWGDGGRLVLSVDRVIEEILYDAGELGELVGEVILLCEGRATLPEEDLSLEYFQV
jgi:hypothetical protein